MFTLPENLDSLSRAELAALYDQATEAINAANGVEGDLTPEQMDDLEAILNARDTVTARIGVVDAEITAVNERRASLRERAVVEAPADPNLPIEPVAVEVAEPVAEVVAEPALVAAGTRRPSAAAAASQAPASAPAPSSRPAAVPLLTITASGNIPDFERGQELDGLSQVTQAFLSRVQAFGPNPNDMESGVFELSPDFTRHSIAKMRRADRANTVDREMSLEAQFEAIMAASDERTQFGAGTLALTAGGGWCTPSETIYGLSGYETTEGLVDVPEVTARRGGISFTKGPDFMTIFGDSNAGFIQTEAQAIADQAKPCYAITCPAFSEVRLDAVGFCATAPLLTNAAHPELVQRTLSLLLAAHARRKSSSTISRISTLIGAATVWAPVDVQGSNSGFSDTLEAVEFNALRIRQSLAMAPNATIEGIAPYWLRAAHRGELSRRGGDISFLNVTDAQLDSYWATRGIRLQYVYDYQMLGSGTVAQGTANGATSTWTRFPSNVEVMLYPAGAFTRLVNDVISLDAVYDKALLTQNTYTAAFMEEGMGIANTRGFGLKVNIGQNPNGATGFAAIGAKSGDAFA